MRTYSSVNPEPTGQSGFVPSSIVEAGALEIAQRGQELIQARVVEDLDITPEQAQALKNIGPIPVSEEQAREQGRSVREILTDKQIQHLKEIKEAVWTEDLEAQVRGIAEQMSDEEKRALRDRAEEMRREFAPEH